MPTVRTRSERGLHGLPFLGQVDPLLDTSYAADTITPDPNAGTPLVYGPQPTPETVAINQLVAAGYMADPGLTPPAPTVAVPAAQAPSTNWLAKLFAPAAPVTPTVGLPPGPAPRVNVPLSTSSLSQLFTGSTLISGIPNVAVLGLGVLAFSLLMDGAGGRRRRR